MTSPDTQLQAAGRPSTVESLVLYAFHLALPIAFLATVAGTGGLLLFPPLLALTWFALERKGLRQRVPAFAGSAYAVLETIVWISVGFRLAFAFDARWAVVALVSATLFWPVAIRRAKTAWLGGYLVLFWLFLGATTWMAKGLGMTLLYGALTVFLVRHWNGARTILLRWSRAVVFVPFLLLALAAVGGIFRYANRSDLAPRILSQPGVTALLPTGDAWPKALSRKVRFVSELCNPDSLLIGAGGDKHAASLAILNRSDGSLNYGKHILESSLGAAVDCERGKLFVGSEYTNEVVEYALDSVSRSRVVYSVPGVRPRLLGLVGTARFLFVVQDGPFAHRLVELETGRAWEVAGLHESHCFFEKEGKLWVAWASLANPELNFDVVWLSGEDGGLRRLKGPKAGWRHLMKGIFPAQEYCTRDEASGRLFFTQLRRGRVAAASEDKGREPQWKVLEPGLTEIAISPDGRLLAVANTVTGWVNLLQAVTLGKQGKVFLGPRIGRLAFSRDGRRLYAPSAAGVFQVDLSLNRTP